MTNNNKNVVDMNGSPRTWLPRLLSVIVLIGSFLAVTFNQAAQSLSESFRPGTERYLYEMLGNISFLSAFMASVWLVMYYKGAYSVLWRKSNEQKLDERQMQVRNRVFLLSYRWLPILVLLGIGTYDSANWRVRAILSYVFFIMVLTLPSILAAWHKNSK